MKVGVREPKVTTVRGHAGRVSRGRLVCAQAEGDRRGWHSIKSFIQIFLSGLVSASRLKVFLIFTLS